MLEPLLELKSLSIAFGGLQAVSDLTLTVNRGEIVSLIGPNGAGKTTVFNCITGFYQPEGSIRVQGKEIVGKAPHVITRNGVARTFQNIRLFPNMSALENVLVGCDARNATSVAAALARTPKMRLMEKEGNRKAIELMKFVGIDKHSEELARNLSYGDQRRLEIARALGTEPQIILLDEPAAGMNTAEKQSLMHLIRRVQEFGTTILLIDHDMKVVMGISDRITVLNFGVKIADGPPDEVRSNPDVVAAYLGEPTDES